MAAYTVVPAKLLISWNHSVAVVKSMSQRCICCADVTHKLCAESLISLC